MNQSQRGSVFFYILLAVALFAALGYAISRGAGGQSLSQERADMLAGELIQQGNMFRDAVVRIRTNGFTKDQISFENSISPGYVNAGCTSTRCRIFSPDGGGLEWMNPPPGANTSRTWGFTGTPAVAGFGRTSPASPACSLTEPCAELVAVVPFIQDDVCRRINVRANIGDVILIANRNETSGRFPILTSYAASGLIFSTATVTGGTVTNRPFFCVRSNSATGAATALVQSGAPITSPLNVFYYVLLAN
jgi:hypothetical protein